MLAKILMICLICAGIGSAVVFADLKDFADKSREEARENRSGQSRATPSPSPSPTPAPTPTPKPLWELLSDLGDALSRDRATPTPGSRSTPEPRPSSSSSDQASADSSDAWADRFRVTLDSDFWGAGDKGNGFHAAFRAKVAPVGTDDSHADSGSNLRLRVGPAIDVAYLNDKKNSLSILGVGGALSLTYKANVEIDTYLQYSQMFGVLDFGGGAFGGRLIIAYTPVALEIRAGGLFYSGITYFDFEAGLGILVDPVEFYAGYRLIAGSYDWIQGPFIGLRVHF